MRASALALSILFLLGATAFAQTEAMRPTDVTAEQVGKGIAVEGRVYSTANRKQVKSACISAPILVRLFEPSFSRAIYTSSKWTW